MRISPVLVTVAAVAVAAGCSGHSAASYPSGADLARTLRCTGYFTVGGPPGAGEREAHEEGQCARDGKNIKIRMFTDAAQVHDAVAYSRSYLCALKARGGVSPSGLIVSGANWYVELIDETDFGRAQRIAADLGGVASTLHC